MKLKHLIHSAIILHLTGCLAGDQLGTKVKTVGSISKYTGNRTDTVNSSNFTFNFAYLVAASKLVYLQGSTNSKSAIKSACNSAGTNCTCVFIGADGSTVLESSTSANISYDTTGNYIRCSYTGATAPTYVKLRNANSTKVTSNYEAQTTLDIYDILGTTLSKSKVRSISRYTCEHSYVQKSDDLASDPSPVVSTSCSATTACNGAYDLCLLNFNIPYYVYQDSNSSNLNEKPTDKLINAETGGLMCGQMLRSYECYVTDSTSTSGRANNNDALDVKFGLYSEATGIFDTAISLTSGPETASAVYGYAAQTSTYNATTVCPPGLTLMSLYTATPVQTDITTAPNVMSTYPTSGVTFTEIASSLPSTISPHKQSGGTCNGTNCPFTYYTASNIAQTVGGGGSFTYTQGTSFCVIDESML